jgi:hypothetical protein
MPKFSQIIHETTLIAMHLAKPDQTSSFAV